MIPEPEDAECPWFTITVDFSRDDPIPDCQADPCPVCLGCSVCLSFHGYGRGCTDKTCPMLTDE
jgi:hypothetical protein